MTWHAVIKGHLQSKANSRRLVMTHGVPRFVKSVDALAWERIALLQLNNKRPARPLDGELRIMVDVYYPSRRNDLDISLLMDVLQKAAVIQNDRQITEQHAFRYVDKDNPRVEVTLEARRNG